MFDCIQYTNYFLMNNENFISGSTEEEIWQQVKAQLLKDPELLEYIAIIIHDGRKIIINIDIDLGGGFESGYETTTFTAPLQTNPEFRFAIHEEHFTDEIGKFFGMQDLVIGYKEFDEKLIIKSNDKAKTRKLFASPSVRSVFENLSNFTFGIATHHANEPHKKDAYLELNIESGITDPDQLRELYSAFYSVLTALDQ
jgi:hypothetical protein